MMKTVSIINQKGGVGKTTTALELGRGLGNKGFKVLFIDMDPQGNLSYTLNHEATEYNALDLLQGKTLGGVELSTVVYSCCLISSSPYLSSCDKVLNETGREYKLKEALEPVKDKFDYCIIDTPPALGTVTINALTASESLIIPTQADFYSLLGIQQLKDTLLTVKKYCNPSLYCRGLLLTRYNTRSNFRKGVSSLLEQLAAELDTRVFTTHIREGVALPEAQALKTSVYEYAPRSGVAQDYKEFIKEFLTYEAEKS